MTIPLIKESEETTKIWHGILEKCYFCNLPCRLWHENTNNPCCKLCARKHKVSELPDYGQRIRAEKRKKARNLKKAISNRLTNGFT